MKKNGILNEVILSVIGSMGHTDKLVICDAGLPIPKDTKRVDLTLERGYPPFLVVLESVLKDIVVEKVYIAEEMKGKSPKLYDELMKIIGEIPVIEVLHEEFKIMTKGTDVKSTIRTGECTPYANIILQSGVDF